MDDEPVEDVRAGSKLLPTQELRCIPWFSINGDQTLRLDYELTEKSRVFDLGGHKGQWASDIFSKYRCAIHIFEPVEEFADSIEDRFAHNNSIFLHRFGLGVETKRADISISGDASSLFKDGGEVREILLVKAIDFFKDNDIDKIDLMKINIEGAEYDLLEHLIDANFIHNIMNIQVQFHDFVSGAAERSTKLREALRKTHYLTYQYEFVWENWRIREIPETIQECSKRMTSLYKEIDFHSNELLTARRDNVSLRLELRDTEAQLDISQNELREVRAELQTIKKSISFRFGYLILHPWRLPKYIVQMAMDKFKLC